MSGRRLLPFGILLLTGLAIASAQGQTRDLWGHTVVSVSYTADGPVNGPEIESLLELRTGRPLTEGATGATIRNLFATRQFSDVLIDAQPALGGVAVTVHLFRAFRVSPLRFSRGVPLSREELRRMVPFSEGSVFEAPALEQGAGNLKRRLEEEGYLGAQVFPEVSFDRKTFDASVMYRIEAGQPAKVARAFFDGDTAPFTPAQLLKKARLEEGDQYRESKARADATRMLEFLHQNSRLKASVELIAAQPTEEGRLMPVYRVRVGPKVLFETRGVKARKVRREVHELLEGQTFDEDLILQYVEKERRELQRKGHYRARVDYSIAESPGAVTVTVTLEEGPHFEVERIAFSGNDSVKEKDLLALMVTRKKGLPLLRPGHLVDEDLADDISAILGYYQASGWVEARVEKPRVTEGSNPPRLVVTIPIHEGPRAVVRSRKILGGEHVDPAELETKLLVKVGAPFNPNQVRQDVFNLQSYYRDRGWRDISVKDEFTLSAEKTSADVVYRIEEGLRSFFGKTIVRGNSRTDSSRVARLVTWEEGRPFSEAELLQTQRNLTRAGVFRRAELRPEPADPVTQVRNVQVELQEGRPLALLYGLGYQYAPNALLDRQDPFAVAGVSYNNLFGKMLSAGMEGQVSFSKRFRLQLSLREPYLFSRDIPLTTLFFATREPIQDIDIERLGFVNEVAHFFGPSFRVALRAEYQRIRPVNPEKLPDIERKNFPRFDQPIEEATIGPNFFYDRRDDIVDPHSGYYAAAAVKYAFPIWRAKARYTKVSTQAVYFRPVRSSVVALSARGGGIFPYGPSDIPVPIAERFFAGGASTNRGFPTDVLGIPGVTVDNDTRATPHSGTGDGTCQEGFPSLAAYDCDATPRPIGGNGFLAFNAEFRFPIAGNIGGTVFYDVAQVWKRFSDIRLRLEGADGLRQGAGVGLHYLTPIGPLRVGYGFPVDRRVIAYKVTTTDQNRNTIVLGSGTVKEKGRFFVSLGYPF